MASNTFYQLAGKKMRELVKPYGFQKSGRYFFRITEDGVVQQFCLLWLYNSFTIRFYLSSIYGCFGRNGEGMEISELINGSINQWLSDPRLGYCVNTDYTEEAAADICLQVTKDVLLPFFESHKAPLSAKVFMINHNHTIANGIAKYDLNELGFNLSLGDLDSTRDFLVHHIENADMYNKLWWKEVKQEYHQLLDAICTEDCNFISSYMEEKKNATYAEYKWKGKL